MQQCVWCLVEQLSSKFGRKDWVSQMWMGSCDLLLLGLFVIGAVCLDSLKERRSFKDVDGGLLLAPFIV